MVTAAGGAPAVSTRTFRRSGAFVGRVDPASAGSKVRRTSSGALAMLIRMVGAAQSRVIASSRISVKIARGSTLRRHTCVAPTAVTIQTKVHPLAWNIGRGQRYWSAGDIG